MALIRRGIHLDTHGADDGAAVFERLAEAARAAGLRACPVCQPDAIARYAVSPLLIP